MPDFIKQLDEITVEFLQAFGHLNEEQLNWKPNSQTWSIAQNIDHLMVINNTYDPIIQNIRNGKYQAPWHAQFDFIVNFFGKTILGAVEPARRKKMKTFPIWEPRQSNIPGNILHQFQKHQVLLKERINSCGDLIAKRTIIASPANRIIVYKLETAFEIMIAHERRHFNQAREVLSQIP